MRAEYLELHSWSSGPSELPSVPGPGRPGQETSSPDSMLPPYAAGACTRVNWHGWEWHWMVWSGLHQSEITLSAVVWFGFAWQKMPLIWSTCCRFALTLTWLLQSCVALDWKILTLAFVCKSGPDYITETGWSMGITVSWCSFLLLFLQKTHQDNLFTNYSREQHFIWASFNYKQFFISSSFCLISIHVKLPHKPLPLLCYSYCTAVNFNSRLPVSISN